MMMMHSKVQTQGGPLCFHFEEEEEKEEKRKSSCCSSSNWEYEFILRPFIRGTHINVNICRLA